MWHIVLRAHLTDGKQVGGQAPSWTSAAMYAMMKEGLWQPSVGNSKLTYGVLIMHSHGYFFKSSNFIMINIILHPHVTRAIKEIGQLLSSKSFTWLQLKVNKSLLLIW